MTSNIFAKLLEKPLYYSRDTNKFYIASSSTVEFELYELAGALENQLKTKLINDYKLSKIIYSAAVVGKGFLEYELNENEEFEGHFVSVQQVSV